MLWAVASEPAERSGPNPLEIEHDDRAVVARDSVLTLSGSVYAAVMGFVLTAVVGRLFGSEVSGYFFEGVALFMILNGISLLGSDTGMVRSVAAFRAVHDPARVRDTFAVTVGPVLAWSCLVAGGLVLATPALAGRLAPHDETVARTYLVVLALSLIPGVVGHACLCATRSMGSLRPYVGFYQVFLPTTRVLGVVLVAALDVPVRWLMLCYAVPLVLMDLWVFVFCWRRVHAEMTEPVPLTRERFRRAFGKEWSFNLPRGVAFTFDVALVWIDVLIVGILLGPGPAGAYAVASRFMTSGTMALEALRLGTSPMIAAAFARQEPARVQSIYALSSVWLVLLSWPVFLGFAAFAPFVLSLMGTDFLQAATAMTVMSLGMLAHLSMGNINSVLLMAGRSVQTMRISGTSLAVNIALNLLLVPHFGLVGASIAWASALALDSVLCLSWAQRHLDISLPYRGSALAAAITLVAWGLPAAAVRVWGAQNIVWALGFAVVGLAAYVLLLRHWRAPLGLHGLGEMLRARVAQ